MRRDEDAARAKEEAEEQRIQEVDAARRLAILRGEVPPPIEEPEPEEAGLAPSRGHDRDTYSGSGRKRKRHGEDDTDFEMRLARESATRKPASNPTTTTAHTCAPLVDSKGHISLFPSPETTGARPREKNEEATKEAARKERELKDQYQMRLVNAAGKEGQGLTDGGPWYASADGEASAALVPSKNVFGRDDPERKVREAARLGASDPLAMMKRGAKMVRELDRGRKKEGEERERELRELEKEEKREERRRERKRRRAEKEHSRRDRSSDSRGRDGGSERRGHPHRRYDEEYRAEKRDRSEERGRYSRESRDDVRDRPERSRRHHEERKRDGSRERVGGREGDRHGSHHRRDENRHSRLT